jgi:hypothetical protein
MIHEPTHPQECKRRPSGGRDQAERAGKVLLTFVVLLPALLALCGLVIDGGVLMGTYRRAQHASDAAATAAARDLVLGRSATQAEFKAEQIIAGHNDFPDANVTVNTPPSSGAYAGVAGCVEVLLTDEPQTHFGGFIGGGALSQVATRSVAGSRPSTTGAAIVVLDPDPPQLAVPLIGGVLPALPSLVGGLEIEGLGTLRVDGAVLVNTKWRGQDENGETVGEGSSPPWAIASLNLLTAGRLRARDIRVVGGVDNPNYYAHFTSGQPSPLAAGKLTVKDPYQDLPVPTVAADPANVVDVYRGTVNIADLPLSPWRYLNPGVYDWIQVISGNVVFRPGVYIIRGTNPVTGIALNLVGGRIDADGVMFYVTDSPGYSASVGLPDAGDGETVPAAPGVLTLVPSVVINLADVSSYFRGLNDSSSPFNRMLLYQRRTSRRPVVVASLLGSGAEDVRGTLYSKWGHVVLASYGETNSRIVAGTVRLVAVFGLTINPTSLLPPAQDVFLLE